MNTYYRVQNPNRNPHDLLETEHQTSTSYCNDTTRTGISVCETIEDLAQYLAVTGIMQNDWVLVTLRGTPADELDEDHDMGAILIHPTEIISVTSMDDGLMPRIHEILDADEAGLAFT